MTMRPENGGFLLGRIIPQGFAASSEAEGNEIGNAFEKDPTLLYKSIESTITINMTLKQYELIQGISLVNHNFPETVEIKFRFCTDDSFSPESIEIEKTIPYAPKNTHLITNDIQQTYKYLQLYISSNSPIQIGYVYLAKKAFQFPHNYSWGYEDKFEVLKLTDTTDYGINYETPDPDEGEPPAPESRKFRITFNDIDNQFYETFFDLIRPGKKIWIPSFQGAKCHYGIIPDDSIDAKRKKGTDIFSIRFWEDAI
ncbi:MAG: hypothetical protein JSV88_25580 [Candidatus Aminicenantes bacterium]|nr:MAG: hypothetical protein JSV88_25580 [Candidatus Aminicenantes bacterium]